MGRIVEFVVYGFKSRLSWRVFQYVMLASLFFTCLTSAFQLWANYRKDRALIDQNLQFIQVSYLPALINSLYTFDDSQIRFVLQGILQLQGIQYLEVRDALNPWAARIVAGNPGSPRDLVQIFPLTYVSPKETSRLGTLLVVVSFDVVHQHLRRDVAIILSANAVQIFLVALTSLMLSYALITRHLVTMARYTAHLDIETLEPTLALRRGRWFAPQTDELTQVAAAFNNLRLRLQQDIRQRQEAEASLRKSEAKYRFMMEHITDVIWQITPDLRYTFSSPADEYQRGYKPEEVIGRSIFDFMTPQSAAQVKVQARARQHLAQQGVRLESATYEIEQSCKDGRLIWTEVVSTPLYSPAGELTGFQGVTRDITTRKRAESMMEVTLQALQISEERYQKAQKMGHVGNWEYSLQTTQFWGSEEAKRIYGLDLAQVDFSTDEVENCIPDRERVHQALIDLIEAGQEYHLELEIHPKDSSDTRIISSIAELQRDEHGEPLKVIGVIQDITARKRVEAELRQAKQQAENSARAASEILAKLNEAQQIASIGSWDWDLQTKNVWWSDETYRIFEVTPQEFTPRFETNAQFIHPDDLAAYGNAFEQTLKTGAVLDFEVRLVNPAGRLKYCIAKGKAMYDDSGKPIRVVGTIMDISQRKKIEHDLAESERRLRLHIEKTPVAVIEWDPDFRVTSWNPAAERMFGYTLAEALGQPARLIVPEHAKPAVAVVWNQLLLQAGGERSTNENITKDGRTIICDWYNTPLTTADGKVLGVASLAQDITARKQAEAEIQKLNAELEQRVVERTAKLAAANKELKDFAYVVSHDLKAPLRGIGQIIQWLLQDYAATFDAQGQEMLTLLINRVKRLDKLIDGILQYSRIGRISENRRPVELTHLLREVVDLLAPPAQTRIAVAPDLPVIFADQTRIAQVFQNLISNALKFMDKPAGDITVGCLDQADYWQFSVTDNGPGIEPRYHEKIFQIFQTLKPRDEEENTGVGLAIVKKIVEGAGGQIWVESTIGKGSTFVFTLPKTSQ